jgi:hypothetical protein
MTNTANASVSGNLLISTEFVTDHANIHLALCSPVPQADGFAYLH